MCFYILREIILKKSLMGFSDYQNHSYRTKQNQNTSSDQGLELMLGIDYDGQATHNACHSYPTNPYKECEFYTQRQ